MPHKLPHPREGRCLISFTLFYFSFMITDVEGYAYFVAIISKRSIEATHPLSQCKHLNGGNLNLIFHSYTFTIFNKKSVSVMTSMANCFLYH